MLDLSIGRDCVGTRAERHSRRIVAPHRLDPDPMAGLADEHPGLAGLTALTVSVVRLPDQPRSCPLRRIMTTVARENLALADELHTPNVCRPYAVVRRAATIDVVCFRDDLASALLCGDPTARLACRVPLREHIAKATEAKQITVAFETPISFRSNGIDHMTPEASQVLGSLRLRWESLGLPPLPDIAVKRVPSWVPSGLRTAGLPGKNGIVMCGLTGLVRYALYPLESDAERQTAAVLLRFGELRGVGHGTSYGMGRMRILRTGERWDGVQRSVWEG